MYLYASLELNDFVSGDDIKIYGYVRVSSNVQNEKGKINSFEELRKNIKDIFIDKQSGKDFDRE